MWSIPSYAVETGKDVFMKIPTLKKNKEFYRVYNRGKAYVSPVVVIYVFRRRYGVPKIGITTGKKIGKAVMRNRARRVIMAALRELYPRIDNRYDIVFVARGRTPFVKSTEVLRCMEKQLKKAGVLI